MKENKARHLGGKCRSSAGAARPFPCVPDPISQRIWALRQFSLDLCLTTWCTSGKMNSFWNRLGMVVNAWRSSPDMLPLSGSRLILFHVPLFLLQFEWCTLNCKDLVFVCAHMCSSSIELLWLFKVIVSNRGEFVWGMYWDVQQIPSKALPAPPLLFGFWIKPLMSYFGLLSCISRSDTITNWWDTHAGWSLDSALWFKEWPRHCDQLAPFAEGSLCTLVKGWDWYLIDTSFCSQPSKQFH